MQKHFMDIYNKYEVIILGFLIAIITELWGITFTGCFSFLVNPFYSILILIFFICVIIGIKSKLFQIITTSIILVFQILLDTFFIFLYDTNGTVFEWAMYNQRTDAAGTLETFDLEYKFMFLMLFVVGLFIFIMLKKLKKDKNSKFILKRKGKNFITVMGIISLIAIILIPTLEITGKNTYIAKLYDKSSNNYQRIGIIGNSIYQLIKGKPNVDIRDLNNVDKYIYKNKIKTSDYNGLSKDNNLILILVESLEWYPLTKYPKYSQILYPNITKLLNKGMFGSTYYEKEKTDVSEALSVLGNYPTGQYINYDFANNSYPFSLPQLLKKNNPKMQINSFHANYGDFYNRYYLHQQWGFNKLYAIDEMKEFGVNDCWNHKKGERNLDSITFEKMKEKMFPIDEKFFSFVLSFSMHGYYGKRASLKEYYEILDNNNILKDTENINDEYLKTYMAALMDFDRAMGIMLDYLEQNKILDDTTIILYSDHNTYYNKLSNYAKNIKEKYNPELFHLPFLIYDEKLTKKYYDNNKTNQITKFITASDIVPTVLDLFGIDGWSNLYFGNSILLNDIESMIYSRNYGFFLTDKFIGHSLNSSLYENKNLTEKELKDIEKRALKHLKKLEVIDKIYYSDYFKNHKYKRN